MDGHRVIKLLPEEAETIKAEWRELNKNHPEKDDAYFAEAGKILEKELEMYKSKLTRLSDKEKVGLTADLLTPQQQALLGEIRETIEKKSPVSPIDQKFNDLLSSISEQRVQVLSKLGGRKSNKRSRSRSQNKRYSRRRSNVGKRRQYSSRRK